MYSGTMRTYARQPRRVSDHHDSERQYKRIRMDDTGVIYEDVATVVEPTTPPRVVLTGTSSPISVKNAIFSSEAPRELTVSPPSSPPPRIVSPSLKSHKPAFSFLKRKRTDVESTTGPLSEVPPNSTNARKGFGPAKKMRLTQMQIDLGGELRRACKGCGMEYIPSNAEDAALHKKFHSMNIGGVDMGRGFAKDVTVVGSIGDGEVVAMVEAKSALGLRNKVRKVLEVVNRELGAVEVDESMLWGKVCDAVAANQKGAKGKRRGLRAAKTEGANEERFKAFLFLAGDKCTGLCLAERIHTASRVEDSKDREFLENEAGVAARSSSVMIEATGDPALLGISRIWTSKSHRRKGIASALMDCARANFFYGIEVPKDMVAFSQPSESGGKLAEGWFGDRSGWHVYAEGA